MYKIGHIGINVLIYSPILFIQFIFSNYITGLIGLFIMVKYASLPDIDLKYKFLTHRGFTHTYSFAILFGGIISMVSLVVSSIIFNFGIEINLFYVLFWSFSIGILTIGGHLIGDIITPTGITPFKKPKYFPNIRIFNNKKYTLNKCKASSKIANYSFLLTGLISLSFFVFTYMFILDTFK